jgi:hypothetical protein
MIALIRAGSLTTDSPSPIGLRPTTSASVAGSVTDQPWNSMSPVPSSTNTAGQCSLSVSGSIAMKRSAMAVLPGWQLRWLARLSSEGHPPVALSQALRGICHRGETPGRYDQRYACQRVAPPVPDRRGRSLVLNAAHQCRIRRLGFRTSVCDFGPPVLEISRCPTDFGRARTAASVMCYLGGGVS